MTGEDLFYSYLQSYDDYFWQWEDNGEVVAIPNSYTIAYRDYLIALLEQLAIQGLPRFGSILLVAIAIKPNGLTLLAEVKKRVKGDMLEDYNKRAILNRAFNTLEILAKVPKHYTQGEQGILFFQTIFKEAHNSISSDKSKKILGVYRDKMREKKDFFMVKPVLGLEVAFNDFSTIASLRGQYKKVEDVIQALTNLPKVPEEVLELEPPEPDRTSEEINLMDELSEHPRTYTAGTLVKYIWSGLNIPLHQKLPSQQPLGGIADITNKGNFDKLLPTEFAHDDTVFMSRLANNEALYFNRETPPQQEDLERILLIDSSLYNWGTTKTLAFALALAIAHHPKAQRPYQVFAIGNNCQALAMGSATEVISSMNVLSPNTDAAKGLEAFFREVKHAGKEIFLISNKEALAQPAMRMALNQWRGNIRYWLHPEASGEVQFYEQRVGVKRLLKQFHLPFAEIWQKEKPKGKVRQETLREYPLLFPAPRGAVAFIRSNDGQCFKIIKGNSAILKAYPRIPDFEENWSMVNKHGWELVCERLPYTNGHFAIGKNDREEYILLIFNPNDRKITLFNLQDRTKVQAEFKEWQSAANSHFFFFENQFYFYGFQQYYTISFKGKIERDDQDLEKIRKAFHAHTAARDQLQKRLHYAITVFKNVKKVGLSSTGCLVFNIHELRLSEYNIVKLMSNQGVVFHYEAEQLYEGEFAFSDGSRVTVHPGGMLILQSSNKDIPVIYIPSVIDKSLAMATHTHFAGNDYYAKNATARFENTEDVLVLESVGDNPDSIAELLLDTAGGWTTSNISAKLKDLPAILDMPLDMAKKLQPLLEKHGARASFYQEEPSLLSQLSPQAFYDRFIQAFISHIQQSCKLS